VQVVPSHGRGRLTPWQKGQSGNPRGISPERAAMLKTLEECHLPRLPALLDALYTKALAGDVFAARLWLEQVRGPVRPRKDEEIEKAVDARIMELLQEARQRRTGANENRLGVGHEPESTGTSDSTPKTPGVPPNGEATDK
jgi:hypothetical protein